MRKFPLTTKSNIKAVAIVSLFMLGFVLYSQWVALQEVKRDYDRQLDIITTYLVEKTPADFAAITNAYAGENFGIEQQRAVNEKLQPVISNTLLTSKGVKFGYYSLALRRVVAIGPNFDESLLMTVNTRMFDNYNATAVSKGESKDAFMWYGTTMLYNLKPITVKGQVAGVAFACANMGSIYADLETSCLAIMLGGFFALLIVVALFQDIFFKLKQNLVLYADEVINGRAKQFESEIPELTPIFKYISEQSENMSRLDRLNIIGEMAASIGHEVRNPMTTVRGFLQYMLEKEKCGDSKVHFELMIQELDRANSIIAEFLSLAKNKSMSFLSLNLNKVINDVFPLLQIDAMRHNCELKTSLTIVPDVLLDENSIRQLILNLVRNAIEAMPKGGTVTIGTSRANNQVFLSVKDQGTGIAPEILDKLGTPFLTTKEAGVGLGLAVCYRIIHRHTATVAVTSAVDKGTTFDIAFHCPPN